MCKLKKIDELLIRDHYYLRKEDECYYFIEYMSRLGYRHSRANNLIHNFKKPVTYKNHPAWKYTLAAIHQIAAIFRQSLEEIIKMDDVTLVPMPPSKTKADPEYDDRILQLIHSWTYDIDVDIKELIMMRKTIPASHYRADRPDPEALKQFLIVERSLAINIHPTILLIDDVITTGAHFVACKELLSKKFPKTNIKGLFVARTIWPSPADDFAEPLELA